MVVNQHTSFERDRPPPSIHFWGTSSNPNLPPTPTKEMQPSRADPNTPSVAADSKKTCDISNLMSPPEPVPLDSFRLVDGGAKPHQSVSVDIRPVPHPPLSPPFSPPATTVSPTLAPIPDKDPIIYPNAEIAASPPQGPLFTPTTGALEPTKAVTQQLVDEHIASRPASLFRSATPPTRDEYELALFFKSNCFKMFSENPKAYLRKERELLQADRKNIAVARPMTKLAPILPASRPSAHKPQIFKTMNGRIQKPKSPKDKPATTAPRPIRATPTTVRQTIRVSATPEPRARTVAPNREDKDFTSLPNYCPPLDSLPNKPNSLKVDWKGNPLDLSKDPHAHLLHPDEILLAAGLRLDCATYLTSKRRIFIRRLECAQIGKEFRKTDAQQACKIDVNKASKLWTAYDKVGWLDIKWMRGFREQN
jgi:hypothetical protein